MRTAPLRYDARPVSVDRAAVLELRSQGFALDTSETDSLRHPAARRTAKLHDGLGMKRDEQAQGAQF